jgi:hypothetical protein
VQTEVDTTSRKAIELAWDTFRARRRWPSTKDFLLRAIDAGLKVPALQQSPVISLRAGAGEEVRPTFEALLTVQEVRDLLSPLAAVLRQAAQVFVANALTVQERFLPDLHFRDVVGHWDAPDRARMAFGVIRSTASGLFLGSSSSGTDPDDVTFHISFDYLRYEHVADLEDVLSAREGRRPIDPGPYPSGQHLELLQRIYESSKRDQRWPRALSFGLETRSLGYIPQLVSELRPRFVRTEFQATQRHSLELTLEALRFVDPSGDDRRLFAKAVRGIVDIWRAGTGPVDIPVAELAASLGAPPDQLGPIAAVLDASPWCTTGHVKEDGHRGLVLRPGDPVLVLRNAHVNTFEEYMQTWDEERRPAFLPMSFHASTNLADAPGRDAPPVPDLPFGFINRDTYRRVLEADLTELRRTVDAKAWKASLILIGGIIEGALLDVLSRREDLALSELRKKDLSKASLMDLIEAGARLGLVPEPALPFAQCAKDYRDLVHPFRSGASPLRPAVESVRAMLHALELIVKDLDAAMLDGRISRFELA